MADRPEFKLETVLRIRRRAFEEKQRVVATRLRAIGHEQSLIEATRLQMHEQNDYSRMVQSQDRLDVVAVRSHRTQVTYLARCLTDCETRIRGHEKELDCERDEMIKASIAAKALEKLKERQQTRYLEESRRQETAEQDEFAVQTYHRKQSNGSG